MSGEVYALITAGVAIGALIAYLVRALIKSKEREGDAIAGRVEAGGRAEQYRMAMETSDRNAKSWRIRNESLRKELDEVSEKWVPRDVRSARERVLQEWRRAEDAAAGSAAPSGGGPAVVRPATDPKAG